MDINKKLPPTDVVDGFIVHHEGTIGVFQGGVSTQGGVVGLHHSRGHLRGGVDGELQFGSLAIVHRETLHEERSESRSSSSSEGMEDKETLESSAGF